VACGQWRLGGWVGWVIVRFDESFGVLGRITGKHLRLGKTYDYCLLNHLDGGLGNFGLKQVDRSIYLALYSIWQL